MTDEMSLAATVLRWALADAFGPVRHTGGEPSVERKVRTEAQHFLLDPEGEWAEAREAWCDAAGILPEAVHRYAVKQFAAGCA